MRIAKSLLGLVLSLTIFLLIPQPVSAQGTSGNVGFELRQGQDKRISVHLNKGYVVKGSIEVLQGAKVEFDLANQEVTINVCKFGFVGGGEYYYVAEVDGWYNLVVTNTSFGIVWGELSYLIEPSNLPVRSTSGRLTATWTGKGWESTLPRSSQPLTSGPD